MLNKYSLYKHTPLAFAHPHTDKARSLQLVPIGDIFQRRVPLGTGVEVAPGLRAPGGWPVTVPPSDGPSAPVTEPSPPLSYPPRYPAPVRSRQACSGAVATAMMVIQVPSLTLITVTLHLCSQTHTNTN